METICIPPDRRTLLRQGGQAIAGTLALGLCLGLPLGTRPMLAGAGLLPLIVVGTTLIMLPALYIGSSLMGHPLPMTELGRTSLGTLRSFGLVAAGLSPAAAFLLLTGTSHYELLLVALVGSAAIIGLRTLYLSVTQREAPSWQQRGLVAVWGLISLGIGLNFTLRLMMTLQEL